MRFAQKLDKLLWFSMMIAPLVICAISNINGAMTLLETLQGLSSLDVLQPMKTVLDNNGIIFNNTVYLFAWWVAQVTLMHILIDVLLYVPKMAQHICSKYLGGTEK